MSAFDPKRIFGPGKLLRRKVMGKPHFADRKSLLCAMGEHSTMLDASPRRLEHRELQIVYWSTQITPLRVAHADRFPIGNVLGHGVGCS
jgi:hypothetical protein